jgi:hypothetical protein
VLHRPVELATRKRTSHPQSELHQILRERDWSQKVFAGFVGIIAVVRILIDLRPEMRHDDSLNPRFRRHLADVFRRDVLFAHVAKKSSLLFGRFCLPIAVTLKSSRLVGCLIRRLPGDTSAGADAGAKLGRGLIKTQPTAFAKMAFSHQEGIC